MTTASPEYLPLTISWNLTQRCNLACAHCYIEATRGAADPDELSEQEAREVLDQLAAVNPQAVLILTGGEPLLRSDIYDLIARAAQKGFWTVLGSHGGLLDEATASKLVSAGLKGVGVSLDSVEASAHDRFRGIPGAWKNTVSAIETMRRKGLSFLIEMTVTRANRHELSAMADFAIEKGAAALNVFFLVPTGRGARLNDLSPMEYEEVLNELATLQTERAGSLLINAKCAPHYRRVLWEKDQNSPFVRTFAGGGCPAGTYYCRINPKGEVTACPYMPLSAGNLRKTTFAQLWRESPLLKEFREAKRSGRCGDCEFSELCGGCRCRALAVTGDYLGEDPSCVYEPGRYGKERIPLPLEKTYGSAQKETLTWTPEARKRLEAVPFFARGMVLKAVEKSAQDRGLIVISEEFMLELRKAMVGKFPIPSKNAPGSSRLS